MRIALYHNNNDLRIEEMKIPEISPDELLVKILHSGICGSDVMEWYRIKKAPLVLGHEIAGIIEKVGENISTFKPSDRVFVSHHVPCNDCHYCKKGAHTDCDTLHNTNFDPGGFAEYIRVPPLQTKIGTFVIPDGIPLELGVFIEPLACVVRGQRRVGINPGDTVLVLGSGISGLLHIALAKANGAGIIIATDINETRLNAAKQYGADYAFNARDDLTKNILEVNDGKLVDVAVICAGAIEAHQQALDCTDRSGSILLFGVAAPGQIWNLSVFDYWYKGIKMIPSYGAAPNDIVDAINIIKSGKIDLSSMITHRLPLTEIQKGFDLVANADNSIKIIIEPHS